MGPALGVRDFVLDDRGKVRVVGLGQPGHDEVVAQVAALGLGGVAAEGRDKLGGDKEPCDEARVDWGCGIWVLGAGHEE